MRSLEWEDGLVHIGCQSEHERLQSVIYVECEGEDTTIAWKWADGEVPTCFECIAAAHT